MIDRKVRGGNASSTSAQAQPLAKPETSGTGGQSSTVPEDEIRIHAYQLYKRRGGSEDHAVEDWLMAEAHLTARKNRANKTIAR